GVEHDIGALIARHLLGPDLVDIGADDVDEGAGLILGRADLALLLAGALAELIGDLGRGRWVDAEDEIADQGQDGDADAAPRDRAAAHAATVLNTTASSTLPAHVRAPSSRVEIPGYAGTRVEGKGCVG